MALQPSQIEERPTPAEIELAAAGIDGPVHEGKPPVMCAALIRWLGSYQLFQNSVTGEMIRAPQGTVHPDTGEGLSTYLTKHDREKQKDFSERLKSAFYLGLPSEVIETYLAAIFHQEANRDLVIRHFGESAGPELMANVDGQGHDIRWWMRNEVARISLINGWCAILVDIAPAGEERLPYARAIDPTRLWDWDRDSVTGLFRYALIREDAERWRAWYPSHSELIDARGKVLGVVPHDFGVVPLFLCLNSQGSQAGAPLPFGLSLIRDVARIARHILDLCSELDDNERKALFSQLHIKQDAPKKKAIEGEIVGGYNYYFLTSADVEWLSSPVEIPAAFREQIKFWIEMLLRCAGIWTGVEKLQEQHSGAALAYWFSDKVMRVRTRIEEIEAAENRLWSWFSFMLGLGDGDTPEHLHLVSFPRDYSVVPVGEELEEIKAIMGIAGQLSGYGQEGSPLRSALLEWVGIKTARTIRRDAGNTPESAPLIDRLLSWLDTTQRYPLGASPFAAELPAPSEPEEVDDSEPEEADDAG